MTAVPSPEGARGAEPATGSERLRALAREVARKHCDMLDSGMDCGECAALITTFAAALARAEADARKDEREACIRDVCYGCKYGVPLLVCRTAGGWVDSKHVYADGVVFGGCAAGTIYLRAEAAGTAGPPPRPDAQMAKPPVGA